MPDSSLIHALACALLAGEPTVDHLHDRCRRMLGKSWRWIRPLAQRYVNAFDHQSRPRHREVIAFLRRDVGLRRALSKYADEIVISELSSTPQPMLPVRAAEAWDIPAIESTGDLAKWLGLSPGELRWFADLKGLGHKTREPHLRHYHYRILSKRFGNIRLIESPKPRLKDLQRQILIWILEKIPAHPAVHGFVRGRSIKTFVAPHVGRRVVLRMDLCDFFPTFGGVRIQNLFRTLGYPEAVADLLGGICTNATPRDIWRESCTEFDQSVLSEAERFYARPHLPQGAPTSPALANLSCYRIDCRLSALAESAGAGYTRYADDLAFSGDRDFERGVQRFAVHAAAVVSEEGFRVNHRKTRVMRRGVRQHLAGLSTNVKMNITRQDFDQLKAILKNCVRHGAESQNRDHRPNFRSHLHGKVSFVEMINPAKAKRLRALLEQVRWD